MRAKLFWQEPIRLWPFVHYLFQIRERCGESIDHSVSSTYASLYLQGTQTHREKRERERQQFTKAALKDQHHFKEALAECGAAAYANVGLVSVGKHEEITRPLIAASI